MVSNSLGTIETDTAQCKRRLPNTRESGERNCQLDLLRSAAISMVVAYHVIQMSPHPLPRLMVLARWGQYGVDLFFVLSGWLIGRLYWKERERFGHVDLLRFWGRRWVRTIPPYLAALGLAWLAVHVERHQPFDWRYFAFVQNYEAQIPFFLVSWSLCIEEHFYLLLPALLVLGARKKWAIALLFGALILAAPLGRCWLSQDGVPPSFGFALTATHLRMEGLLLGFGAAYLLSFSISTWRVAQRWCGWVAAGAAASLGAVLCFPDIWMYRLGLSVLAVGMTAALVWLVGKRPGPVASSKLVRRVALSSYSVYLTHALALHLARKTLKAEPMLPWGTYFPLALGLVTTAGAAFYFGFERTAIMVRDHWIPRRKGETTRGQLQPC